ncbi:MAG TPA: hypothetical protein VGL66_12690 [Caulobacteraceae bacterium]|jgi:hypothetical protein
MAYYRLYFMSGDQIRRVIELDCKDDDDAIQTVEKHRDGHPMELWNRARLVQRFPAPPPIRSGSLGGIRVGPVLRR